MTVLRIFVLKTVSMKEFVRIWSVVAIAFLVTVVGLLIVGIILF